MATENTLPQTLACPIASEASQSDVNKIPVEPTPLSALASQKQGFPHLTMLPLTEGGESPYGEDFNGLFNLVSSHTFYLQNGGSYTFNQDVSDAIGGYPKNALLWYFHENETPCIVRSLINDNTNNFVNDPTLIDGIHWEMLVNPSSYANIALTNSPYTTNRILEIPQDIKLELNNGTLTLKAGSKVYVPNGFEADGTTPKFDVVNINSDLTSTNSFSGTYNDIAITLKTDTNSIVGDVMSAKWCSGATDALSSITGAHFWYDTTNNIVKLMKGTTQVTTCSFPICLMGNVGGEGFKYINKIFNGFGYIGSTVFALPGVKVQTPNGRNEDGTYKSVIRTVDSVQTFNAGDWGTKNLKLCFTGSTSDIMFQAQIVERFTYNKQFSSDNVTFSYDKNTGLWWLSTDKSSWNKNWVNILGSCRVENGRVTFFEPYTVDSVVNSNEFYQLKDKAVTTDTTQTISGSKRFTQPPEGMSIELTADTNQQTVPAEPTLRQLGFYRNATYTKGDGYTSWLQALRGSDGWTATELYTRRFLESDSQEIINYLRVNVTPDGIPVSYTKTPPVGVTGEEIVTAGWVRNAFLFPGEIIIWSAPTPPAGYLICDGSAISRTTYANLFRVIGTTWGAGDGNTTFNIPNFTDRIPQGSGTRGSVGDYKSESLPNITGTTGFARNTSGGGWVGTYGPNGCFYQASTNTGHGLGSSQTTVTAGVLGFAASNISSTYQDKAPVQQAATVVNFCIRY